MKLLPIVFVLGAAASTALPADAKPNDAPHANEIEDAENYKTLTSASPELLQFAMQLHHDEIHMLLDAIEKHKEDPERLQRMIETWRQIFKEHPYPIDIDFIERMKPRDEVFYFEYEMVGENARYWDKGILVIREGDVVYRRPFRARTSRDPSVDREDVITIERNLDDL